MMYLVFPVLLSVLGVQGVQVSQVPQVWVHFYTPHLGLPFLLYIRENLVDPKIRVVLKETAEIMFPLNSLFMSYPGYDAALLMSSRYSPGMDLPGAPWGPCIPIGPKSPGGPLSPTAPGSPTSPGGQKVWLKP